jgi:hypothetical protein
MLFSVKGHWTVSFDRLLRGQRVTHVTTFYIQMGDASVAPFSNDNRNIRKGDSLRIMYSILTNELVPVRLRFRCPGALEYQLWFSCMDNNSTVGGNYMAGISFLHHKLRIRHARQLGGNYIVGHLKFALQLNRGCNTVVTGVTES